MNRYEHSLLDLCGRIHGAYTGSGEGIPDDEAAGLVAWLRWRLSGAGWEPSRRVDFAAYENAVHHLCYVALGELQHYSRSGEK